MDVEMENAEENIENSIANNSREEELIWASESLRVSDDEDDEKVEENKVAASEKNNESALDNVEEDSQEPPSNPKKRVSNIIDSESEEEANEPNTETKVPKIADSESEEEANEPKKEIKVSKIVDSESDEESKKNLTDNEEELQTTKKKVSKIIDSDSDDAEEEKSTQKSKSRVIDSDSEGNEENSKSIKKPSKIIDSDSEPEEPSKPKKFSALIDSESEPDHSDVPSDSEKKQKIKKLKKKKEKIKETKQERESDDSDGSSSGSGSADDSDKEEEGAPIPVREKKVQRASAKKALDEISAIKSETQRLLRETQVAIPYHKPKQHSLKEFMSRRNVTNPEEKLKAVASAPRVKMSHEELEVYAKKLDEREKESEEFFKSESGDEKTNEGENENQPSEEKIPEEGASEGSSAPQTEVEPKKVLDIDNLKKMLNIPKLSESPKLSGSSDMLIDLDSGDIVPKKPTGVDKLFQRFLKSNGKLNSPKSPMETTVKVLSTENGKLEMTSLNVSISNDNTPKNKEPKPYEGYLKLQQNLKSLIQKKRQEDFSKKVEDSIVEEKERKMLCGDEDEDDEDFDEEEDDEIAQIKREQKAKLKAKEIYVNEDEEIEEVMEDDDVQEEDLENEGNEELGEEQEDIADERPDEDEEAEEDEEADEDDQSSEDEEPEDKDTTKKNRIIKAFEDSDEEGDLIKTQKLTQFTTKSPKKTESLFTPDENHSDVENELLEICSGQFTETQKDSIPQTQGKATEDELMELCSGTFVTQAEPKEKVEILSVQVLNPTSEEVVEETTEPKTITRIVSSDEEDNTNPVDEKKIKKRKKKRVKKLGFSDDEESEEEEDEEEDIEEEVEEDLPETYIDYDSEENEVEVVLNKKDVAKEANKFVDNEAELSESEWGSADEDEKDLDKYDIELGDEDKFDQDKIQKELGQIHMRNMLDEDARNVKKLTEMFFEDEETDGVGRQRQFRWKNAEKGFSLDDPNGTGEGETKLEDGEEESEEQWRKLRFEREQAKLEMEANGDTTLMAETTISISKKFNIITAKNQTANEYKENSPFLISKARAAMNTTRGSFLVRGNEVLDKLAAMTEGSAPTVSDGSAGTIQNKATKGKGNFVFKHLNEEEHKLIQKRKAEALLGPENNNNVKKQKLEKQQKVCLIDQLL